MSRTLAMKSGSVDSLKVSNRCGCSRRRAISAVPSKLTVHWPAPCRASSSGWHWRLCLKSADDHRFDAGIIDRARRPPIAAHPEDRQADARRSGVATYRPYRKRYPGEPPQLCSARRQRRPGLSAPAAPSPCAVLRREASDANSERSTSFNSSGSKRRPITILPKYEDSPAIFESIWSPLNFRFGTLAHGADHATGYPPRSESRRRNITSFLDLPNILANRE